MAIWFNNLSKAGSYNNNPIDRLNWTLTNVDEITKSGRNGLEPDEFKAVCLSGVADQDSNAREKDGVMRIAVRPLTHCKLSAETINDPREESTAEGINKAIDIHRSLFSAISKWDAKDHSPIKFGQVVVCKYHGVNSSGQPTDLRFEEPTGIMLIKEYLDLAAIDGVNAGALFTPPGQWPAGMQSVINGISAMVQKLADFANGGGQTAPGAGKAYEGGNNTKHPRDEGIARADAHTLGLNYNTHGPRKTYPTQIVIHCTAGSGNYKRTLKSQNKDVDDRLGYNFLINRDGKFTQCVHPDLACHHAGGTGNISIPRYGFKVGNYLESVGVSFCNIAGDAYKLAPGESRKKEPRPLKLPGFAGYIEASPLSYDEFNHNMKISSRSKWHEKYSQASIDTGIKVCAILCLRYEMDPVNCIWTHQSITTKGDPGGTFYPVEAEQGIKYDPNLDLFKSKVKQMMTQMKGKQLKDEHNRIVAGYMAPADPTPPETPPGETPPEGEKPEDPSTEPVDNTGKKL